MWRITLTTTSNDTENTAQKLSLWADILLTRANNGLHFASNIYDQEHYRKIREVALELLALASAKSVEDFEPLHADLFAHHAPIPVSDAAIIDERGRILLIRRADNLRWAMPGGGLDVGETPAQGAVREALEETGLACEPVALVGVHDSRLCGTVSNAQLYHFLFLCRLKPGVERIDPPTHANEIKEMGWFAEDVLPDDLDPGHATRIPEAFRVWRGDSRAYFDAHGS